MDLYSVVPAGKEELDGNHSSFCHRFLLIILVLVPRIRGDGKDGLTVVGRQTVVARNAGENQVREQLT